MVERSSTANLMIDNSMRTVIQDGRREMMIGAKVHKTEKIGIQLPRTGRIDAKLHRSGRIGVKLQRTGKIGVKLHKTEDKVSKIKKKMEKNDGREIKIEGKTIRIGGTIDKMERNLKEEDKSLREVKIDVRIIKTESKIVNIEDKTNGRTGVLMTEIKTRNKTNVKLELKTSPLKGHLKIRPSDSLRGRMNGNKKDFQLRGRLIHRTLNQQKKIKLQHLLKIFGRRGKLIKRPNSVRNVRSKTSQEKKKVSLKRRKKGKD